MKDTIKKIWDNSLEEWVHKGSWDGPEILATYTEREKAYQRLIKEFSNEQMRLIDEYISQKHIIEDVEMRNSFICGFSLGVRLVAEALGE